MAWCASALPGTPSQLFHRSLAGGGALPRPGELSLARRVLFLDELAEFPGECWINCANLEEGELWLRSPEMQIPLPHHPGGCRQSCPCGWFGDPDHPAGAPHCNASATGHACQALCWIASIFSSAWSD